MSEFMNKRFAEAVTAIARERDYQDGKYGPVLRHAYHALPRLKEPAKVVLPSELHNAVEGPGGHELAAWLLIIEAELAEAKKAAIHGGFQTAQGRDSIRAEIVQIAAVCVAALQQHGVVE